MRSLRRAVLWLAIGAAVWTGIMLGLCGGLYGFLASDPAGETEASDLRELWDRDPALVPQLAYLGDSNCEAQERTGHGVPRLRDLLQDGIRAGRMGPGWTLACQCGPGLNGFDFERMAAKLVRSGPVPRAVLMPISLRSLNTLGSNGFDRKKRGKDLWKRPVPYRTWSRIAPAFARAWWGWNAKFLADLAGRSPADGAALAWRPDPYIRKPCNPPPSTDKDIRFQVIYGSGYHLNYGQLDALLQAGLHLREAGSAVFYVVSPAPLAELEQRWGPGSRAPVEAGDRTVVRFLRDRGLWVLDLHGQCQDGFYESPREHLNGKGRQALAARLLQWMSQSLGAMPAAPQAARALAPGGLPPC